MTPQDTTETEIEDPQDAYVNDTDDIYEIPKNSDSGDIKRKKTEKDSADDTPCSLCSSSLSTSSSSDHGIELEGLLHACDTDPLGGFQGSSQILTGHGQKVLPSPIFSPSWQASRTFGSVGGCLREPGSDVTLLVPIDAVKKDSCVEVHTAVCSDLDHIRLALNLPDNEEIVSPLAEYWGGQDFRFQRSVCITLPHCLPPNYDVGLVRVYHLARRHDGHLVICSMKNIVGKDVNTADNVDTASKERDSQSSNTEREKESDSKPKDQQQIGDYMNPTVVGKTVPKENVILDKGDFGWAESGYFQIDTDGQIQITTYRFCGYVCTYCHDKQDKKRPQLFIMGCGSFASSPDSGPSITLSVHVWDSRIKVKDFRKARNFLCFLCLFVLLLSFYFIGRRIYLNLSKSTESAAGLKALMPVGAT